jgi:hypothetical protein
VKENNLHDSRIKIFAEMIPTALSSAEFTRRLHCSAGSNGLSYIYTIRDVANTTPGIKADRLPD